MFLPSDQDSLRNAMLTLERENTRLRKEVSHSNTLLEALSSLLLIDAHEDPFQHVFRSLHAVFEFDQAAAFGEDTPGEVTCHTATGEHLIHSRWKCGSFLKRVLDGHTAASIRNRLIPESVTAPAGLMPADGTALFVPITMASGHGFLMLVKQAGENGFNSADIALARKFSVLASHAMMASFSRRQIQAREIRARAAEKANRAHNNFISSMSHELRTPLNAIIGFSEFMNAGILGPIGVEKYKEYVRDINASGNYLLALVDNILLYSKISAGQHQVEMGPLDLETEIRDAYNALAISAHVHQTPVFIDSSLHDITVLSDQRSLRQILLNLIDNAIKFSPAGQPVQINGNYQGTTFVLRIIDNGKGISENVRQHLGTPFLQTEDVLSRKSHGTGLGLAISIKLAESVSARMKIDDTVKKGTTMQLILPLAHTQNKCSNHSAEKCAEQRA